MKPKIKTVCLLCKTGMKDGESSKEDHFCRRKASPWHGSRVTALSSCSYRALIGNKITFRMKLAMLAQGLANKLSE
jgi:hypothetical protein